MLANTKLLCQAAWLPAVQYSTCDAIRWWYCILFPPNVPRIDESSVIHSHTGDIRLCALEKWPYGRLHLAYSVLIIDCYNILDQPISQSELNFFWLIWCWEPTWFINENRVTLQSFRLLFQYNKYATCFVLIQRRNRSTILCSVKDSVPSSYGPHVRRVELSPVYYSLRLF